VLDHEKGRRVLIRVAVRGFTLVEIMITLAVLAFLMFIGLPAMGEFLQATQIRTAAESVTHGMQLARAEAVRRNSPVRFQFVSTLADDCVITASGPHWIVSRNDPTGACEQAEVTDFLEPNDTSIPQIVQKRSNTDGSPNATFAATDDGAASTTVVFNTLGRVSNGTGIDSVNVENPTGTCKASGGNLRCLRIVVSTGGDIRLCDPAITIVGDTRRC